MTIPRSGALSDTDRTALRSVRLNWAPTYEEVWESATELHVDGLHAGVWEDLEDALGDAIDSTGPCPTGLVITGNAGTGKTHLLTRFRDEVQSRGHYFVLLELLDSSDFWRTALSSMRSSLLRPSRDHPTQLAQLIWLLSDEAGLSRAQRREFSSDAVPTPETLDALVTAMSKRRPQVRRYHGVLRSLVLLGSPDSRLADLGSAFLDDVEVEETAAQRLHWGLPAQGFAPVETVRAISAFLAETGATVFAVDQIDTLLAQSASVLGGSSDTESGDSETVEQIGHGLMALRQGLYRSVTVACMLPTAWETLQTRATASVADRFRVAGPLKTLPDGALARAIVERRLAASYRAKEFTPPHPTWPVAPGAFASAVHHTPRDLLTRVDNHIRNCLASRELNELVSFDETATRREQTDDNELGSASSVDELARLDARFEDLRIHAGIGNVATDQFAADRAMGPLIEAGLRAWTREDGGDGFAVERGGRQLDGRLRRRVTGGGIAQTTEDEQHWSFRAVPATNPISVTNRLRGAVAGAGLVAGQPRRQLFLLRSTPWPTTPRAAAVVADAFERGAQELPLDEGDLATLHALAELIEEAPDGFDDWLLSRRPAHGLRLFARLGRVREAGEPRRAPADAAAPDRVESVAARAARRARALVPGDAVGKVGGLSSAMADLMFSGSSSPAAAVGGSTSSALSRPPRAAEHTVQPIVVGTAAGGRPIEIDPADLRKHTAIFAGSGSGKTVLIRRIVEECALRGISAIVLDPNNDLSRLGQAWPEPPGGWGADDGQRAADYLRDTEVVVWTPNRQSARPLVLQPVPDFVALRAGTEGDSIDAQEAREGYAMAVEACASALESHVGVGGQRREQQRAILRESLAAFGGQTAVSTVQNYIDFLREWDSSRSKLPSADKLAPGLADNLQAALINNPLLGGEGETIDPASLLTPSAGKRARVSVISLIGLPDETQQQTFVAQLQLALFSWVKRNPAGDRPLGWLLVMDEAQRIAPSGTVRPSTESTLLLASQARKYGLGLVFATQSPTGVHNKVVGNSATHFYGKLNAPAQIQRAKELAAARGGKIDSIGGLAAGDFYLGASDSTTRIHSPLCLSYHSPSPPTEDEVLEISRGG